MGDEIEMDTEEVTVIAGDLKQTANAVDSSNGAKPIPDHLESDLPSTLESLYRAEEEASRVTGTDLRTMAQECEEAVERAEDADN